jgi:flavin reductase (DIM6/NTAB) family NADH-FMN oxidoreductase RutF
MRHWDKVSILEANSFYRRNLINNLSGYKSLNLVGTKSKEGLTNLAIFSQVFHVGANPPYVGVLFRPDTVVRHTLNNILETDFFTLNHVTPDFYKEAHLTAARWEDSEFESVGIKPEYLHDFFAPYVKNSPVKLGCKLVETQRIEVNQTILVIGSIEQVYVEEKGLREDGSLDLNMLETVTVTGLYEYHVGKKIGRLHHAKTDGEVRLI